MAAIDIPGEPASSQTEVPEGAVDPLEDGLEANVTWYWCWKFMGSSIWLAEVTTHRPTGTMFTVEKVAVLEDRAHCSPVPAPPRYSLTVAVVPFSM